MKNDKPDKKQVKNIPEQEKESLKLEVSEEYTELWGEVAARFIAALSLDMVGGVYASAATVAGVNRQYVYELFEKYPDFKTKCKAIRNSKKEWLADLAESHLIKLINDDNPASIIYTLKKKRPEEWGDKGQDEGAGPVEITHTISEDFSNYIKTKYGVK